MIGSYEFRLVCPHLDCVRSVVRREAVVPRTVTTRSVAALRVLCRDHAAAHNRDGSVR